MKTVLISIRPQWCEFIANGEKTIEVRKTRPETEIPFKCCIYCTKEHTADDRLWIFGKKAREQFGNSVNIAHLCGAKDVGGAYKGNGKVIGEFVCDRIINVDCDSVAPFDKDLELYIDKQCCLTREELFKYTNGKCAYGLHISMLKIYDKPKELSEFVRPRSCPYGFDCEVCKKPHACSIRPPQSWCYVEVSE